MKRCTCLLLFLFPCAFASPSLSQHRRNYISPNELLPSYDYIICGGGLAGLVIAAGLSDADVDDGNGGKTKAKVLVLEAGSNGDDVRSQIDTPGDTYYNTLLADNSPYDWGYKTQPQANVSNRQISQPRGKVLGGSSAVNGLYIVRPPKEHIDAWHSLLTSDSNSTSATETWTWDSFHKDMIAAETFTPPSQSVQDATGSTIKYNTDSRGSSGKLHVSYPGYMPSMSSAWLPTLNAIGVPSNEDAYGGNNLGAFIATSSINPTNWTRSYSRTGWIDPLPPRDNLHIVTGATVGRILWADNVQSGELQASGVEFSMGAGQASQTVSAGKEVVLAAGAFGSPQILQLSGVGPRDVLMAANVTVKLDLPGVGQHFSDHVAAGVFLKTKDGVKTAGTIQKGQGDDAGVATSKEFQSFVNDAIAYVNGSFLFDGDDSFQTFMKSVADQLEESVSSRVPSTSEDISAGYRELYQTTLQKMIPTTGMVEILYSINADGQIAVQAALQNAFSRGRLWITTSDPYVAPNIDPGYFSHPADLAILRQGLKVARRIASTPPLSDLLDSEILPGADVQSDSQIEDYLRSTISTEYHPASTCSMIPHKLGGVVDATFKVYGTLNVRVVDASVVPIGVSAHMMSVVYPIAERGVQTILGGGKSSSNGTTSGSGSSDGGQNGSSSGAERVLLTSVSALLVMVVAWTLLLL